MNKDIFAVWLERQGFYLIRIGETNFYNAGFGVYQAFPYYEEINIADNELKYYFNKKAIALRFSSPIQSGSGNISYHVISKSCFEINKLPKKVRHDVSRGLNYANYTPITFEYLAKNGWLLRYETLGRQGRIGAETEKWWQALCLSAKGLPGFEAWGAIHDGELCAALLGFYNEDDRCFSILYQQSLTNELKNGVNNALAFQVTNEVLAREHGAWVFYGLHSLDAPASVDEFKFRMGFQAKAVRQRVVFSPHLAPFINPFTYSGLNTVHKVLPGNSIFAKAEGLVRFYLQGKLPLVEQDWPNALSEQKDAILALTIPADEE